MVKAGFLLCAFILAMTAAQILYKFAGNHSLVHNGIVDGWLLNHYLWAALVTLAVGMILWMLALRRIPLSRAYPWTAGIYVLTPLCSTLFFHDPLSLRYILGMGLIVAGIAITVKPQQTSL